MNYHDTFSPPEEIMIMKQVLFYLENLIFSADKHIINFSAFLILTSCLTFPPKKRLTIGSDLIYFHSWSEWAVQKNFVESLTKNMHLRIILCLCVCVCE